jgi:hypothetical protein
MTNEPFFWYSVRLVVVSLKRLLLGSISVWLT